ncbi:MAG: hypothetical protein WCA35_09570 [Kovacikia sp.]
MLSNTLFMKTTRTSISACRSCRYYVPEGRRGGSCQQLNVAVQSAWKACSLAIPPFVPAWDNLEEIIVWQKITLAAQEALESNNAHPDEQTTVGEPLPVQAKLALESNLALEIKAL